MAVLVWDKIGERFYETGVSKGVVYPYNSEAAAGASPYDKGEAWNGLTSVNLNPSGADETKLWADNIKYLSLRAAEEFGFTIEAYTYPDSFATLDGTAEIIKGVTIGQQERGVFGFSYRSIVGNDTKMNDYGEKIHLIYGATVSPSARDYGTVNDSPDVNPFSWEATTTPVNVTNHKPTAHIEIDVTKLTGTAKTNLAELEKKLYGTAEKDAYLPLPDEVFSTLTGT